MVKVIRLKVKKCSRPKRQRKGERDDVTMIIYDVSVSFISSSFILVLRDAFGFLLW